MLVPFDWLREVVDVPVDGRTLAHDLTMSGTKIEAVHGAALDFDGVVVGRVLERAKHPDADRLSLCRVDVGGGEVLDIVCGAANVRAGLTVAVARVGARLAGGLKIRRSKIRGAISEGMICSVRELGLGDDAEGILELPPGLAVGGDYAAVAGGGLVLEAEITPNRPDCLSILGVAREVAALYGGTLRLPPVWEPPAGLPAGQVPVEIEAPADCGRYLGRTLRDVRVAPSPAWLQARLRSLGLHPINNVVDVTNFVLFECGQPLHAFDLEKLRGPRIAVRRARAGEYLRTLDGAGRTLDPGILVIADAAGPVALAGIMGGAESAVGDATRHLFLEAAYFDPGLVRSGRRKQGLSTDSSYRFERGADIEAPRWAADRAALLLAEIAGARVVEADADAYPAPYRAPVVALRVERCNRLVGTDLPAAEMVRLLGRLALPAEPRADRVDVRVPSFRRDLAAEIDLVEEVARAHGYERIPADVLPPAPLVHIEDERQALRHRLRDVAVGLGYFEVRTSAFMDRRDPDRLQLGDADPRRRLVGVANPLVASLDTMRTSLLPGMLRVLLHNRNHGQEALRFAQVDRAFVDVPGPHPGLPSEPESLVLLAAGDAAPPSWGQPARPYDLFDLKGDVEALLDHLGVDTTWTYGYTEPFLDDATSFVISGTCGAIGKGGAVRDEVLRAFGLEPPAWAFELDVGALQSELPGPRRHRDQPRLPAAKRDLSLVVPDGVTYQRIHAAVVAAAGPHLEATHCFDVYAGDAARGVARSVGLRLRFRDPNRTLTDAEVNSAVEAITGRLASDLGVTLRAG